MENELANKIYEEHKYLLGCTNHDGEFITETMLRQWVLSSHKLIVCVFCGETYNPNETICSVCKNYKGLMPFIEKVS